MKESKQKLKLGYQSFLETEVISPCSELNSYVFSQVAKDLNPSELSVFVHLSFVCMIAGAISLSFCPQFGVSLSPYHLSLMSYFQALGVIGCGLACGAVFLGSSVLIAGFVLRPEQIKVLVDSRGLQFSALALLSMGALICLGGELVTAEYVIAWLVSSVFSSLLSFKAAVLLRFGNEAFFSF